MLSLDYHSSEVKDALWGTSALLGAGTFATIEATSAEEAWPLKRPGLSDLDWLKMSEGKNAVYRLAEPTREDSAFGAVIEAELRKRQPIPHKPMGLEVDRFLLYCAAFNKNGDTGGQVGPYQKAASIMERIVPIECSHKTVLWFLPS